MTDRKIQYRDALREAMQEEMQESTTDKMEEENAQ